MARSRPPGLPLLSATLIATSLVLAWPAPAAATSVWSEILQVNPRQGAAMVHAGGRFHLVGGYDNAITPQAVWSVDPAEPTPEWELVQAGGGPALSDHSAILDPVGNRIIVFGGRGPSWDPTNDTWELALGPSPAWTQIAPVGTPPDARNGHTAIYDPVRQRMVVFGGSDIDGVVRDDVWELSLSGTPTWAPIAVAPGPAAREEAVAIYDPNGDRMIVSTGTGDNGLRQADTWALSLGAVPTWTLIAATGPAPRSSAAAIYDPSGTRLILAGGTGLSSDDVWELTLAGPPAWAPLSTTGTGPPYYGIAAAAYDPGADRMLMLDVYNHLWSLSLGATAEWTEVLPANAGPGYQGGHSAVRDEVRGRMLMIGDAGIWALSLDASPTWSRITSGASDFRSAVYDPARDRVLAHRTSSAGISEIHEWDLDGAPVWNLVSTSGSPPDEYFAARPMILDSARDRLVLVGVKTGAILEVWELSLGGTPTWSQILPAGVAPEPRYGQAMSFDPVRDRLVMFGGWNQSYLNDLWELSFANGPQWAQLFPTGIAPSPRQQASATYDPVRDRMVVFGGVRFQSSYANLKYLSLDGPPAWSNGPVHPANGGWGRADHSAIYDPEFDRMVVHGGSLTIGVTSSLADTWVLDWKEPPVGVGETGFAMPLSAPRPNPASITVEMSLTATVAGRIRVAVHDVAGRLVRVLDDGTVEPGTRSIVWDLRDRAGRRVRPGLYLLAVESAGQRFSRRVAVVE